MVTKLHLYDFDNTLFRSPEPQGDMGVWYKNLGSLTPPCVPEVPDSGWWTSWVVRSARQSISDPSVYTILATGRRTPFAERVKALLASAGLAFDEVHLKPGGDTLSFKLGLLDRVLQSHPSIEELDVWEDRAPHVKAFADFIRNRGLAGQVHPVTEDPMECELPARLGRQIMRTDRIAARWLESQWNLLAKPEYLKALDFTAGLIRKFNALGLRISSDVSNEDLLKRVIQMRKIAQDGMDLSNLLVNSDLMSAAGARVMQQIEEADSYIDANMPDAADKRAFFREYPNKEPAAIEAQARFFRQAIRSQVDYQACYRCPVEGVQHLSDARLDELVMTDRTFYAKCYQVVLPYAIAAKQAASAALAGGPGVFQIRTKDEQPAWNTSTKKKKIPFYKLHDLCACRSIITNVPDLCAAAKRAQDSLGVLHKDNRYLRFDDGYNAVHYILQEGPLAFEYQLKTKGDFLQASLSHDLIYSDDKFKDKFPSVEAFTTREKQLIRMVLDVSTQLSVREWGQYLQEPFQVSGPPEDTGHLLYEPEEGRSVLASVVGVRWDRVMGVLRLASWGIIDLP